jgi:alpha-N-arabinofuranosidase
MRSTSIRLFLIAAISLSFAANAQTVTLKVETGKQNIVQPTMWGIFFEDINFAADGGIYAELVKNRSFEFTHPLTGWQLHESDKFSMNQKSGDLTIIKTSDPKEVNSHFARAALSSDNGFMLSNEGFKGIGLKKDNTYTFSVMARQQADTPVKIQVQLQDSVGNVLGQTTIEPSGKEWREYSAKINPSKTEPKGKLSLRFNGKGVIDIDMISLFPQDTWKNRPKGLRADLVQLLADMKPGFIRFPGGCIVEGFQLETRYQWKKTIGDPGQRELMKNRWNDEFKHRPAPDYFQTFGLGFYEYFQLAEDIGASPLPILSCGMACQFNSAELVPLDELDPYVQDALDLIEFANGSTQTKWGKVREQMGHPAPFNLKMIGVGNEQWGPQYIERYKIFSDAIRSKYPDIKIVSGTGPFPEGELFDYAAKELKTLKADLVDEHYYQKPDWFFKNAGRYDNYDRNSYKIFAGEFAAQSVATVSPDNKNSWLCALSEAAFMTGLERNADVVHMASYAPLLAHTQAWQWTPDLIWFDNLSAYGTPNYYVQKLFSTNKGTHLATVTLDGKPVSGQQNIYASATWDGGTSEVIVKLVNSADSPTQTEIQLDSKRKYSTTVKGTMLANSDLNSVNSIENPQNVSPIEYTLSMKSNKLGLILPPQSLVVLRIKSR